MHLDALNPSVILGFDQVNAHQLGGNVRGGAGLDAVNICRVVPLDRAKKVPLPAQRYQALGHIGDWTYAPPSAGEKGPVGSSALAGFILVADVSAGAPTLRSGTRLVKQDRSHAARDR